MFAKVFITTEVAPFDGLWCTQNVYTWCLKKTVALLL